MASAVRCLGLLVGALARVPELGLGLGLGSIPGQAQGPGPVGMDAFAELALAIVQKVRNGRMLLVRRCPCFYERLDTALLLIATLPCYCPVNVIYDKLPLPSQLVISFRYHCYHRPVIISRCCCQ